MSIRQAAREFGLSRKTVRKMMQFALGCVANRQSGTEIGDLVLAETLYLRAFQRFYSGIAPRENVICNTSNQFIVRLEELDAFHRT